MKSLIDERASFEKNIRRLKSKVVASSEQGDCRESKNKKPLCLRGVFREPYFLKVIIRRKLDRTRYRRCSYE